MRWFFGLNCPLGSRGKGPRSIFIWPKNKRARAEFVSFGALGEGAYFHSVLSPMPLIFIRCLLLMCLFSFRAFRENFNEDDEKGSHMPRLSYENCKRIFPPSPMTPIFILRLLLRRSFSLRAFSDSVFFHFPILPFSNCAYKKKKTQKEMTSYKNSCDR